MTDNVVPCNERMMSKLKDKEKYFTHMNKLMELFGVLLRYMGADRRRLAFLR